MSIDKSLMKDMNGYLEGDVSSIPAKHYDLVVDYKRRVSGSFSPINLDQVQDKLYGSDFCVTRKLDGELVIIFFEDGQAYGVNTGGVVRAELPCLVELEQTLMNSDLETAVFAAELYSEESQGRSRIYDVMTALGKNGQRDVIHLGVFDVLKMNGEPHRPTHYRETHAIIDDLFSDCTNIKPVSMVAVDGRQKVYEIANQWISEEGAEGVVVHSELSRIFKVKPKHTFDVVIVGYTEGDNENRGKIRDILFAMRHDNGRFQLVGKTGNGFSEDGKKEFYDRLSQLHVQSKYLETDSRNIAYHMVKPEIVVEVSANDIITETSKGLKQNPVLEYDDGYRLLSFSSGISMLHAIFERIRNDKNPDPELVNFTQITDLFFLPQTESPSSNELPVSEILSRNVYVKESKGQKMVQKFVTWKTNKESLDSNYPAYVFHYTNFSPTRKDPLKRDIRISSSEEQILCLRDKFFEENVKKGWNKV